MSTPTLDFSHIGLEIVDLFDGSAYASRRLHSRNGAMQAEGMRRLTTSFVENPETILQELVNAAVQLCGADSAGISIVRQGATDKDYYRWIATAGEYTPFLEASLPKYPSACSVCLDRGCAQLFRVNKRFFEIIGVEAALVTDGILLPWAVEEMRGTIFVMAHGRGEAFDTEDLRLMEVLANLAAMGVRQQRQQEKHLKLAGQRAAVAMAHELAHEINNPLQGLMNRLYIAAEGDGSGSDRDLALKLLADFQRLSELVKKLLELPRQNAV